MSHLRSLKSFRHPHAHASPDFIGRLLHDEGLLWTATMTQSMTPLLRPGDRVQLRHCSPAALALGDLAAIVDGEILLVHRVVAFTQGHIITKGDALPQADRPRPCSFVAGKVIAVEHQGEIRRIRGRWPSVLLARYSLLLTFLDVPSSGFVWRLTRAPFYLLARFE